MAYVAHSPHGVWYTQHTWLWYSSFVLERYSSITWVTRVLTVYLAILIIRNFYFWSILVNNQRARLTTDNKLSLILSLILFLSTKVQLADIWFTLAVCQWWIWALAVGKNLAGRSGPKTFQRKVQIKKTAVETNYVLKQVFIWFFFRLCFFSNVNLSLQNTTR